MAVLKDKGCTDNYDSPIMAFFEGIVPFITTHLKKSRRQPKRQSTAKIP